MPGALVGGRAKSHLRFPPVRPKQRKPDLVKAAIERADQGQGVLVLGDLGSSILTVKSLLAEESNGTNGHVKFADAPFVEGAVAAAVVASAGLPLADVVKAAEDTRGVSKL